LFAAISLWSERNDEKNTRWERYRESEEERVLLVLGLGKVWE
jgi:Rad3-related DNA helicase